MKEIHEKLWKRKEGKVKKVGRNSFNNSFTEEQENDEKP